MSGPPNVGTTLTGGIQDIAALLPLLGTDQCEKHVGSALEGGYLYAAATPLSIFGSLGIVKLGISVLISSISIPKPSLSFELIPYPKLSVTFRGRHWFGARMLDNAGFKPVGSVAPLIAMDGTRYTAETRLVEILKEKHIEDPERLSVGWRSTEWNAMLVVCTTVLAACSVIPYIALISPRFMGPSVVYSPWIFPLLRTVGGSLAAVSCQFLIQSRVISLMKNRIIFMIMDRILLDDLKSKIKENPDLVIRRLNSFRWDEALPSEECLWNLEQYLRSQRSNTQPSESPNAGPGDLPISPSTERSTTRESRDHSGDVSIQMDTFELSKPEAIRDKLRDVRNEHLHTSLLNRAFIFISWTFLFLSLPATVAGYIGCFTLVRGSHGNGPLIWLLLEASLSIIRILIWAWNPSFDERTDITMKLKLTDHEPLVTTEKDIESTSETTLSLVPERQFLQWITSHTGPLEEFQTTENLALYFALTGKRAKQKHLYLTVFDINKRNAVTLYREEEGFKYIDTVVTYNNIASEMQATLQSAIGKDYPGRRNCAILFDALSHYYIAIINALNHSCLQTTTPDNDNQLHMVFGRPMQLFRKPPANDNTQDELQSVKTASLPRKWNLLPKHTESNDQHSATIRKPLSLTEHDKLYLRRGYEHHLKTKLVEKWSTWIVDNMDSIRIDARNDCHHALTDRTSDKAKWELTELDMQVASEWMRREWSLVVSSFELEDILHQHMGVCINQVLKERQNERLGEWMRSEFMVGRRKRLEREREQAKERMERDMKVSAGHAESEGRAWRDQQDFSPIDMWEAGQEFIDEQWEAAIEIREMASPLDLDQQVEENTPRSEWCEDEEGKDRCIFVEQARDRFKHWQHQRKNEKDAMNATIKRISDTDNNHLEAAYQYPESHWVVADRFVDLRYSGLPENFLSAFVYDVLNCNKDTIFNVIQKKTTRSVTNVPQALINSIPENDHLLYLGSDGGQEPPFIQRNRNRWWNQQTSNSSTFYFSPQGVGSGRRYACSWSQTIAHMFISLQTRTRLRLRLLHRQSLQVSISIQEKSNELRLISTNEISEKLQLQDFELDWFEPGRHELQLVVIRKSERGVYCLRDILVEFFEDQPSRPLKDLKESNLGSI